MKVNETPEKIYVDNPNHDFWYRTKDENSIEYVRKDAFIEKACKWLESLYAPDGSIAPCHVHIIEDFKKYMEGE